MSGKRSLPSIWASRGALFAAVAAGSLVLISALGAWLLFTPSDDGASTADRSPTGVSTPAPPSPSEEVADDRVVLRTEPGSEPPQGGVGAVPPSSTVDGSTASSSPRAQGEASPAAPDSPGSGSALAWASATVHPGPSEAPPGSGQGIEVPDSPGTATPPAPKPTATPTPTPTSSSPAAPGRDCPGPGKKDVDPGKKDVDPGKKDVDPGKRAPTDPPPCGRPPTAPPGQEHRPVAAGGVGPGRPVP